MDLKSYSIEIGLREEMSLEDLIASHRNLRALNMKRQEEWMQELAKGREIGRNQGMVQVTNGDYICKSDLEKMTLREICEFLN